MILTFARNALGPWGQKELSKQEGIFSEEIKTVKTECPRGCVGLEEVSRAWPISGWESLASGFVPIASGRNWRAVMQSKGERWVREVPRRLCVFVCLIFFLTFLGGVARERFVGVSTRILHQKCGGQRTALWYCPSPLVDAMGPQRDQHFRCWAVFLAPRSGIL